MKINAELFYFGLSFYHLHASVSNDMPSIVNMKELEKHLQVDTMLDVIRVDMEHLRGAFPKEWQPGQFHNVFFV